jgi:uncharacterized protein YegL
MGSLNMVLDHNDMVENPTPRLPISLVLDVSGSMEGAPLEELNEGMMAFFRSLQEDEVARYAAEVSVVTFGAEVSQVLPFGPLDKVTPPPLTAQGKTPLGEAVSLALANLERRKEFYQALGVDYYQPWMVLMTDGRPTDDVVQAARGTCTLVEKGKLTLFPVAVGEKASLESLSLFSPARTPLRLRDLRFREFFRWLSASVARVSQSIPGEKVELDLVGIRGWANL